MKDSLYDYHLRSRSFRPELYPEPYPEPSVISSVTDFTMVHFGAVASTAIFGSISTLTLYGAVVSYFTVPLLVALFFRTRTYRRFTNWLLDLLPF